MKLPKTIPPILTGVLFAAAFPTPSFWPLAYVGLAPLLLWQRGKGYRETFWGATLAGAVFYGITFLWFASLTYWVGAIVVLGVTILFFAFALCWGIVAAGKKLLDSRMPGISLIIFPALWVVMEYTHNHIFTGFGWGSLGYTQWNNLPVAQMASFGSVYVVSYYLVLINSLLCELWTRVRKSARALPAGAAIIVLCAAAPLWGKAQMQQPDMANSLRVGIVQPNFSLDVKWNYEYAAHMLYIQTKLTELAVAQGAVFVVWPESAIQECVLDNFEPIASLAGANSIHLLLGSERYEFSGGREQEQVKYYNSAFLVSPDGRVLGTYDKMHLAPFGEYVPLSQFLGFVGKVVPKISDFSPGNSRVLFPLDNKKFAIVICFENSFPDLVQKSAKSGADFLVQLTNDGWFGQTAQPRQDLALAVFRAIENGATLIRGTNTGISCFVDPWGRISGTVTAHGKETVFVRGFSVETVSTVAHNTFYKTFGDIWALGCVLISAAALGLCLRGNAVLLKLWKR